MPLDPTEQARVSGADTANVISSLARLRSRIPAWLAPGGPFGLRTPNARALRPNQLTALRDLVAISGPCHCIDGWGFLARALSSLIAGDMHSARHFAYYAELRAALSLLASSGIGIFDGFNVAIDRAGAVLEIDTPQRGRRAKGTHLMAWLALEHWSKGNAAGNLLCEALSLRGVTFRDAITAIWPGASIRAPAFDLIMGWGVDLSRASVDRDSRNESSYRPQMLRPIAASSSRSLDFLDDFWDVFEPDPGDRFLKLDRHLLRTLIEVQYRAITGGTPNSQRENFLRLHYADFPSQLTRLVSEDFLVRAVERNDTPILMCAGQTTSPSRPEEMISRAALLLRLSVAVVNRNMFLAGFQPGEAGFWCEAYGEQRGFWSAGQQPSPIEDLWLDVQEAIGEAKSLRAGAAGFDNFYWFSDVGRGIPRLAEAERIAIWGACT